jgi:hypothetical protein
MPKLGWPVQAAGAVVVLDHEQFFAAMLKQQL